MGFNPLAKGNSEKNPAMKTTCPDFDRNLFFCSVTPQHQMSTQDPTTITIGSHDDSDQ